LSAVLNVLYPFLCRIYKVFDLKNYTMLYKVSDKNVQEIKISPGIMLLIYNRKEGYVPLKILSIDTGEVGFCPCNMGALESS
jgi:hypothetical protein